jgi:hypothetical protein
MSELKDGDTLRQALVSAAWAVHYARGHDAQNPASCDNADCRYYRAALAESRPSDGLAA